MGHWCFVVFILGFITQTCSGGSQKQSLCVCLLKTICDVNWLGAIGFLGAREGFVLLLHCSSCLVCTLVYGSLVCVCAYFHETQKSFGLVSSGRKGRVYA